MSDSPTILGADHLPIRVGSRVRSAYSGDLGLVTRITELDLDAPVRVFVRWDGEHEDDDDATATQRSMFSHYYVDELVSA